MNKKLIDCYNTDASRLVGKAEKVVFPKDVAHVQQIIKSSNIDIVPRGAGTGFVGGCIPDKSVVVDMGKMNKVSQFNPTKKTVYVEAGVTLKELNEKLNALGFEFAIDSFNKGISTIGGMIAKNSFGTKSLRYGPIKEWIEEIEFVNGRGELMKTSKADLMDVCGMEGITGIIVGATLKIMGKIRRSASIFQSNNLDEVLSISRRLKLEKEVVMLEFFSPELSKLLGLSEKYNLIIEFDSDRGKIKGREYEAISKLKDKIYYVLGAQGYYSSDDFKFFFDKLKDFILHLEANQIPYFGFLGSGIIHPFFKDEEEDKKQEIMKFVSRIKAKLSDYGIGLTRKDFVDSFEKKVIQRVKLRHDPFAKLNKNKIIDSGAQKSSYKSKKQAQHLKPMEKDEIEEMKPLLDTELILESEDKPKTPEEEMNEFIEKVELIDEIEEIKKPVENEVRKKLKDYAQTYESELPEERRKKIEEFAKNVAHGIVHPKKEEETVDEEEPEKQDKVEEELKELEDEVEKRGKLTKEEQDKIDEVMFG